MLPFLTSWLSMYIEIGLALFVVGCVVSVASGRTWRESITREGARCGLRTNHGLFYSAWAAILAWPYGLLHGYPD